jgi:hypothetical protein
MQLLSILFLIISASLSGCIMTRVEDYPKDWPALEVQVPGQCPDLTGSFSDTGICEPKEEKRFWGGFACSSLSLASFDFLKLYELNGISPKKYSNDVFVELSLPDPRGFEVAVRNEKSQLLVDRRVFKLNPDHPWLYWPLLQFTQEVLGFDCELGSLRIKKSSFGIFYHVVQMTDSWEFLKAKNGNLIMKESSLGVGFVLGIPFYHKHLYWHRWYSRE